MPQINDLSDEDVLNLLRYGEGSSARASATNPDFGGLEAYMPEREEVLVSDDASETWIDRIPDTMAYKFLTMNPRAAKALYDDPALPARATWDFVKGVGQDAYDSYMLPKRVMDGDIQITGADGYVSQDAVEGATNLAGWVTLGAGAVPAEKNALRAGMGFSGGDDVAKAAKKVAKTSKAAKKTKGKLADLLDVAYDPYSPRKAKAAAMKKSRDAKSLAAMPEVRELPIDDAIAVAKKDRHLYPKKDGGFVGAAPSIRNMKDLRAQRAKVLRNIERNPEGATWYDRARDSYMQMTNGAPEEVDFATRLNGMFSAGVDPRGELNYSVKQLNSGIANQDDFARMVKPSRPAQTKAAARAFSEQDPSLIQLGKKTGKYAEVNNPYRTLSPYVDYSGDDAIQAAARRNSLPEGATGVNDFRWAQEWGWNGGVLEDMTDKRFDATLGGTGHKFMDYETAKLIDTLNRRNVGGKSNWTGPQAQAAGWVNQKADHLWERSNKRYMKEAKHMLEMEGRNVSKMDPAEIEAVARKLNFSEANATVGDFMDEMAAQATYEAQPYRNSGHLPRSASAPYDERLAYMNDPLSSWDGADGRDVIYSGMQIGDNGPSMRVVDTKEMLGRYLPDDGGPVEYNPGRVARPLTSFDLNKGIPKSLPADDAALLRGGEATRAYVDVQGGGAFTKGFRNSGSAAQDTSVFLDKRNAGMATPTELERLLDVGKAYNLTDLTDNNGYLALTNFEGKALPMTAAQKKAFAAQANPLPPHIKGQEVPQAATRYSRIDRGVVDGDLIDFENAWQQGSGSGAATRQYVETMESLPRGAYQAVDQNPKIPLAALDRMERDYKQAGLWGPIREDIQNARRIIGEGPGFIGRLKKAVAAGAILPAIAVAIMGNIDEIIGPTEPTAQAQGNAT
jgi:hypothetical protein